MEIEGLTIQASESYILLSYSLSLSRERESYGSMVQYIVQQQQDAKFQRGPSSLITPQYSTNTLSRALTSTKLGFSYVL
jgi:hypothetical protein